MTRCNFSMTPLRISIRCRSIPDNRRDSLQSLSTRSNLSISWSRAISLSRILTRFCRLLSPQNRKTLLSRSYFKAKFLFLGIFILFILMRESLKIIIPLNGKYSSTLHEIWIIFFELFSVVNRRMMTKASQGKYKF